jgi:ABC-type multidrug transport system fused ATPase/permease subunit
VSFAVSRERLLLDNISLTLEEGTTTAILGRSGSGKTTLLRTVNRMVEPTSGDVLVHGKSVRDADLIASAPRHGLCDSGDRPVSALHRRAQRRRGA